MNKSKLYKRYRFPVDIIQYAVWLYYRFNLSHRDIEDLLAGRRINVTYETIRLWCKKFGLKITWEVVDLKNGDQGRHGVAMPRQKLP